ncbi:MAG: metal-dependent hydrolase [Pseudomonadota bacterium]
MLFFYFVDGGAIHHHRYWVDVPEFWLVVAAAALPVSARAGLLDLASVFLGGVFLHLALDSVTGGIKWLYPVDDTLYEMFPVSATQAHWLLFFVLHWTFLLEFAIWGLAAALWWHSRQVQRRPTHRN